MQTLSGWMYVFPTATFAWSPIRQPNVALAGGCVSRLRAHAASSAKTWRWLRLRSFTSTRGQSLQSSSGPSYPITTLASRSAPTVMSSIAGWSARDRRKRACTCRPWIWFRTVGRRPGKPAVLALSGRIQQAKPRMSAWPLASSVLPRLVPPCQALTPRSSWTRLPAARRMGSPCPEHSTSMGTSISLRADSRACAGSTLTRDIANRSPPLPVSGCPLNRRSPQNRTLPSGR